MFYFLYGNDFKKARANLKKIVSSLRTKKPDAEYFVLSGEDWDNSKFEELLVSQGLFEKKYIVSLDTVFGNADAKDFILSKLDAMKAVESIFVWFEPKVDKATLSKIEKRAEKIQEYELSDGGGKKFVFDNGGFAPGDFNMFALTDALGNRDRKGLWVLYCKALEVGASLEEIHGLLFWQVKSMLLTLSAKSAEDAGMKAYPFSKSKNFAKNYKNEELVRMSGELVQMFHDAHNGLVDFDVALEKWVMGI